MRALRPCVPIRPFTAMRALRPCVPCGHACLAATRAYGISPPFVSCNHACLSTAPAMHPLLPIRYPCHGMFVLTSITQPQPAVQHAQSARVSSVFVQYAALRFREEGRGRESSAASPMSHSAPDSGCQPRDTRRAVGRWS